MSSDPELTSTDDVLEPILESFLERLRQGERPSIEDVVARHPEFAVQIRELLPAMVEIEGLGSIKAAPPRPINTVPSLPFDRLGDYRILGYVGEGGMGVVYEAERESLRSRVALKVMHVRYRADSTYLGRFRREARAAASLHHTNIVSVFDFGEHDGVCFYAMQYIAGQGLDHVLADVRRLRDPGPQAPPEPFDRTQTTPLGYEPSHSIALGMVTGRFESPAAAAPGRELSTSTIPCPHDSSAIVAGPTSPYSEGLPDGPTIPGRGGADRPDSSGSSVSLSGYTETRYFREVARLGA